MSWPATVLDPPPTSMSNCPADTTAAPVVPASPLSWAKTSATSSEVVIAPNSAVSAAAAETVEVGAPTTITLSVVPPCIGGCGGGIWAWATEVANARTVAANETRRIVVFIRIGGLKSVF